MKKQKVCADLSTVFSNQSTNLSGLIIGERGCFSDSKDFSDYEVFKLIRVITTSEYPYEAYIGGGFSRGFKYYIPLNKANFVDDKNNLRPFKSIFELMQKTGRSIGDVITIRRYDNSFIYEETCVLNGYRTVSSSQGITDTILLGATSYTFEELMNDCKYWKDDEWQPFGVEE